MSLAILHRPFFWQSAPLQNVRVIEETPQLKRKSRKSGQSASEEDRNEQSEELEGIASTPSLESSAVNALYRSMSMQAILPIPQFQKPSAPTQNSSLSQTSSEKQTMLGAFENKENILKGDPKAFRPFARPLQETLPKPILQPNASNFNEATNRKWNPPYSIASNPENRPNPSHAIQTPEKTEAPTAAVSLDPLSKVKAVDAYGNSSFSAPNLSSNSGSELSQNMKNIESKPISLAAVRGAAPVKNEPLLVKELSSIQSEIGSQNVITQKSHSPIVPYTERVVQNGIIVEKREAANQFALSPNQALPNLQHLQPGLNQTSILTAQKEKLHELGRQSPLAETALSQNRIIGEKQNLGTATNLDRTFPHQTNQLSSKNESQTSVGHIIQRVDSTNSSKSPASKIAEVAAPGNDSIHKEKLDTPLSSLDKKTPVAAPNPSLFDKETFSPKASFPIGGHSVPSAKATLPISNPLSSLATPQAQVNDQKYTTEPIVNALKNITLTILSHGAATPKIAHVDSQESLAISENPPVVENPEILQEEPAAKPEFTATVYSQPIIIDDYWGVGRL